MTVRASTVDVAPDERRRWRAALDAFVEGLAQARRSLATADRVTDGRTGDQPETGDAPAATATWPPVELPTGPVPDGLRREAESLLAQADTLRDEILAAMARSRPPRRRTASPSTANARWSMRL